MTQSTILAAGTGAGNSTDVVVTGNTGVNIGAFVASGALPADCAIAIVEVTPGAPLQLATLSGLNPVVQVYGPGTFRAVRPATTVPVGVFLES